MTMMQQSKLHASFAEIFDDSEILKQKKRFKDLKTFVQTSTEQFYSGNGKKMRARRVLSKAEASYKKRLPIEVSDLVLLLTDLIPESKYEHLYIFVRSCIVGDFLASVCQFRETTVSDESTFNLLDRLQNLFYDVLRENREAVASFLTLSSNRQWVVTEVAGIKDVAHRERVGNGMMLIVDILLQDISIIWNADDSSDNVALGRALKELQKTNSYLTRRMQRYTFSFMEVEGFCLSWCRSLFENFLKEIKKQCLDEDERLSIVVYTTNGVLEMTQRADRSA